VIGGILMKMGADESRKMWSRWAHGIKIKNPVRQELAGFFILWVQQ
jgi:hypothetical protein